MSAGLELDPNNEQMKQGLAQAQEGANPPKSGGLFGPEFMGRLALNPQTRALLQQPDFVQMLQDCNRNPQNMSRCVEMPLFTAPSVCLEMLRADVQGATWLNMLRHLRKASLLSQVHARQQIPDSTAGSLGHQCHERQPVQGSGATEWKHSVLSCCARI